MSSTPADPSGTPKNNSASSNPPSGSATPTTSNSRFTPTTVTLEDVLKTQTVGLVHLSEFKKRRVELLEAKEREAAERGRGDGSSGNSVTTGKSRNASSSTSSKTGGGPPKKKRKGAGVDRGKLSFAGDEEEEEDGGDGNGTGTGTGASTDREKSATPGAATSRGTTPAASTSRESSLPSDAPSSTSPAPSTTTTTTTNTNTKKPKPNPSLSHPPPKALTKSTLLRETQERELLRREFLALQEAIKSEEIIIPFVFYDGTNVHPREPGVKIKKGEAIWLFLERARRMSGRREWLRVSVDDLLLVRGEVIIPHHYEFYYFIVNKTEGPNGLLFNYPSPVSKEDPNYGKPVLGKEDPVMTKVVDRRWYERNKHIFPASVWTNYEPGKDYRGMVRRDRDNNAFFFG